MNNLLQAVIFDMDGVITKTALTHAAACDILTINYKNAVVVKDAVSGVQAGAKGNFCLVIGTARENNGNELKANGADIVVEDLVEINGLEGLLNLFSKSQQ